MTIDFNDTDNGVLINDALDFSKTVKDTFNVAAQACIDVGKDQGEHPSVVRASIVAEALLIAAHLMPVQDPETFQSMARKAFAAATERLQSRAAH